MLRDFFQFSIQEQRGVVVLLILFAVSVTARFWPWVNTDTIEIIRVEEEVPKPQLVPQKHAYTKKKRSWDLSLFDINYAKAKDLRRYGFSDAFITSWFKTKQTNGFIKNKDQFRQLNLLSNAECVIVEPFLDFSRYATVQYSKKAKVKKELYLDLNSVDSFELKALPGIGNKLSKRIVKFRNRLGGFSSIHQLKDVFGIDSSLFDRIKPYCHLSKQLIRININTASVDVFQSHPYINYKQAKSIIAYRNQHGLYSDVDALKAIYSIDTLWLNKIEPYLTVD